jgi:ubiquinone/menaquinone biosynthesis C-methylase UbiE
MDKKTQESIKNYDSIAANYDDTFDGKYTRGLKQEIVRRVGEDKPNKVLDVACGNGTLLSLISDVIPIQGYGVDISENMVKEAKRKYPHMNFTVSNSSSLPFEDDYFDAVTVCAAFHHFTEPDRFLSEAARVLKAGGHLYISDPYLPPLLRQIGNVYFPLLHMGDVKVYSKKEFKRFLEKHGFHDTSIYRFEYSNMVMGRR